jgi:hypothetical protein
MLTATETANTTPAVSPPQIGAVVSSSFRPVTSALTIPLFFCGHAQKLANRRSGEASCA